MRRADILAYMRASKFAVVGTIGPNGPQGALVGVAVTDDFEIIFDTVRDSRKHRNLEINSRASVTFSGPDEQTLQFEGIAHAVSLDDPTDARWRETYYAAWPDGIARRNWPKISYWRIMPHWLRYSDFARGPLVEEIDFEKER